jgi:peptidyl-prolyl cis-trans isomerase SurA
MGKALFLSLCFLFLLVNGPVSPYSFATETPNRVVAIVNDQIITLHELNKTIKELTGHTAEDLRLRNESQFLDARKHILNQLIDEKIAEQKIKELNIQVGDRQIDAAIERIKRDNQLTHEDLLKMLEEDGLTYERYRQRIKSQIQRTQLIDHEVKSRIIVSDAAISRYYEQNAASFEGEEKVHLASIFLMRKNPADPGEKDELRRRGQEILDKLKAGGAFADIARVYSEGPGADEGGDLGVFRWDQLDPEARKALEGLPEGGFTDPMIRPNGLQIIKIVEKQGGKKKSLEDVRDAIYEILYRQEVDRRYNEWIEGLRKSAYTKIVF